MHSFVSPMLFLPSLGMPELILLFILVLILFGPGKLPDVFRSLGDGVKQFKKAANDITTDHAPVGTPPPEEQKLEEKKI